LVELTRGLKKFAAGVGQNQRIAVCNGVYDFSNHTAGWLRSAEFFVLLGPGPRALGRFSGDRKRIQGHLMTKKTIAVFFGGRSPEHDVSVVSALQVMSALDRSLYDVVPVYLATDGRWWTGEALMQRESYLPSPEVLATLTQVSLDMSANGRPTLLSPNASMFNFGKSAKRIEFDAAIPCFHGLVGEDGQIQGMFETARVPYTGMRTLASAVLMDKVATKRILAGADIPQLPYCEIQRPREGMLVTASELAPIVGDLKGPWIIKPSHLGSSIGVAKVSSLEELADVLPEIFKYDTAAILETFVANMVEYNVSVSRMSGELTTSAIERPKRTDELLNFKEKYLSGGGGKKTGIKGGAKAPGQQASEGMLSLTRELNPNIAHLDADIRRWAGLAFDQVGGTGAPRIDFIGNEETGELWLNEVNPCPGSFGYFLWEAAPEPLLFSEMLDKLIQEALFQHVRGRLPPDPTPSDARLFSRR
jgi:D-alanine-D-alanine ligase